MSCIKQPLSFTESMPARPASAHLQLMLMKPRLISDASAIISGRLKWPPHPSITQKCWELAKISGKLSLERHSASVTLLPLKSMTSVTLLDWEQSDPWGNLPSYTATQSLLKNQRGHFRIRMDEKNLLFWCREGGMAHIQAHNSQTSPYWGGGNRTKICQTVRGIWTLPGS